MRLFNKKGWVLSGIAILVAATFLIATSFTKHSENDLMSKEVNLMIRQLGHKLLLQAGDSTSRVLPVTQIGPGTYRLWFENELTFNHDSLIALSQGLLPKEQFPSGYAVTVHEWLNPDIIYGFQVNRSSPDIIACRGRSQPRGCYVVEITIPDLRTGTGPAVNTSTGDLQAASFQSNSLISPEPGKPFWYLVLSGMLILMGTALLVKGFSKASTVTAGTNHVNEFVPEMAVPKVSLHVNDQHLVLGNEVISLTEKESKILELLNNNFGKLIPRETLIEKVWLDEGVITGRSLDMFISKLRKKLSVNPELRITNIHGKGYKLEIPTRRLP